VVRAVPVAQREADIADPARRGGRSRVILQEFKIGALRFRKTAFLP